MGGLIHVDVGLAVLVGLIVGRRVGGPGGAEWVGLLCVSHILPLPEVGSSTANSSIERREGQSNMLRFTYLTDRESVLWLGFGGPELGAGGPDGFELGGAGGDTVGSGGSEGLEIVGAGGREKLTVGTGGSEGLDTVGAGGLGGSDGFEIVGMGGGEKLTVGTGRETLKVGAEPPVKEVKGAESSFSWRKGLPAAVL